MRPNSDRKLLRAIKRDAAIKAGGLRSYRMPGRTIQPARGKGVPYKRNKKVTDQ